jgi:excinuclease ABC subunit A
MSDRIRNLPERTKFQILAPIVRGKKGTHQKVLSSLTGEGFVRVRVNGEVRELADRIVLDKNQHHTIEIVVDRLVNKAGIESRLSDSLTTCLRHGEGIATISMITDESESKHPNSPTELVFSEKFACPEHGAVMEELSPRLFSFNSPYGACPTCHGLGSSRTFDPELIIPDPEAHVYHAIAPWSDKDTSIYHFSIV